LIIDSFRGQYGFLSNFFDCGFQYDGKIYRTNEHFYQSHKPSLEADKEIIRNAKNAYEAARLGRSCKIKKNWEKIKVPIMKLGLSLKFDNPDLKQMLLETGNQELIEGNKHGDVFWGVCNGKGQNVLGQLLMSLREKLK
jgi:ribA/ribD-fused uncharacterized protein